MSMSRKYSESPEVENPSTGKVANDYNKASAQGETQLNQPRRTPQSRGDREAQIGSSNQSQSRRGRTGR